MIFYYFIFWFSAFILFYAYVGYPLLLFLLSKVLKQSNRKVYSFPSVSIVMVAYNEEIYLERKINNLLNLDYNGELEILVGSDGSNDKTNSIIESYRVKDKRVKGFIFERRQGKVNCLNVIVPKANYEIIFFNDVRQVIDKNALKEITANFEDDSVGCVSGELIFYEDDKTLAAIGVGLYWKYEKFIRQCESCIYSMIGATGAIYAIRKKLFTPPLGNIILDDVFIPMKIVEKGYRALFDKSVIAYDKVASAAKNEFTRKTRTLAGNFQLFFEYHSFFNPFKNKIAFQFFSHKFLRAFAFIFIISLFTVNLFLLDYFFYCLIFIMQLGFFTSALIGYILEIKNVKLKLFSFPYIFCTLNLAAFVGFIKYLSKNQRVTWSKAG